DPRQARAAPRPRVRGRLRPDGRLPDHRRARLRRQHAGLHLDRRPDDPVGRRGPHDGRDDRDLPGQALMRRLALVLGATLAALAGPAVSTAQEEHMHGAADDQAAATVPILFAAFGTPRVDVLTGDTVRWMNNSIRVHTVTADDGTWGSGRLPGQDMFSHRFDAVGVSTYY